MRYYMFNGGISAEIKTFRLFVKLIITNNKNVNQLFNWCNNKFFCH
jgi:hypothetical protein